MAGSAAFTIVTSSRNMNVAETDREERPPLAFHRPRLRHRPPGNSPGCPPPEPTTPTISRRGCRPGLDRLRLDPLRAPKHSPRRGRDVRPAGRALGRRQARRLAVQPAELAQMAKKRHATLARFEGAATGSAAS